MVTEKIIQVVNNVFDILNPQLRPVEIKEQHVQWGLSSRQVHCIAHEARTASHP